MVDGDGVEIVGHLPGSAVEAVHAGLLLEQAQVLAHGLRGDVRLRVGRAFDQPAGIPFLHGRIPEMESLEVVRVRNQLVHRAPHGAPFRRLPRHGPPPLAFDGPADYEPLPLRG